MKIEDSTSPASATYGVQKALFSDIYLSAPEKTLEQFDLSFMELLTGIEKDWQVQEKTATSNNDTEDGLPLTTLNVVPLPVKKATPAPENKPVEKTTEETEDKLLDGVEADMILLKDALTPVDLQYLKQIVIPGLPILTGSVPVQSVFNMDDQGIIAPQSFHLSEALEALIQKGYKTGRPIRVEINENTSLVLKIKNGQVSAQFVSSDYVTSMAMQQQLDELRNRMTLKNLPVGTLDSRYKEHYPSGKKQQQNNHLQHNNKEQ
jgi:hypothetical protein